MKVAWYYCDGSGAMGTGWQFVNGSWYCFSDAGRMLVGEQIIEGVGVSIRVIWRNGYGLV